MEKKIKDSFEQAAAFQKMWMDTMTGMTRVWSAYSPEKPPPEQLKNMRNQTLRAIASSWEEFMRTPQFMEMMRDSMNNGMAWKGAAKEGIDRIHATMQTAAKKDIDGVLLAIRHVEKRVLDRIETLQENIEELDADISKLSDGEGGKMQETFQQEIMRRLGLIEETLKKSKAENAAKAAPKPTATKSAAKRASVAKKAPVAANKAATKKVAKGK